MGKYLSFAGSLIVLFWSGSLVFGYPGVMGSYWKQLLNVGSGEIGNTLFFLLAAVGIFMFFVGKWQEKYGIRSMIILGILICGLSLFLITFPISIEVVYLWAFINGIQSCFVYIPAVTVVQLWFPGSRGLVSGAATMIFGLSAAIMSPVFLGLFETFGYLNMNLILATIILLTGILASIPIHPPEVKERKEIHLPSLTVKESLRKSSFWFLWLVWALQGAAGISMVSLSVPLGESKGLTAQSAVLVLTSFNLTNGASRLISGVISDRFGRNNIMSLSFLLAGIAYFLLLQPLNPLLVYIFTACIGFAFGTMFAVSAPLASDCFGLKHFGAIFGLVFTAYGFIAGIIGPSLSGYILDFTGDFTLVLMYLGIFCLVSSLLIRMVKPG
ncbi:MFS transporter [Archaeoglobales archaeon]|nr:MAG: MFS transporter [Archaeoglobales archaeon]